VADQQLDLVSATRRLLAANQGITAANDNLAAANRELTKLVESLLPPVVHRPPDFIPTDYQRDILDKLNGKALRTDALAMKVGNRRKLFTDPGGLPELQEEGLVCHDKRLGYYRPDAPPADLEDD